MRYVLRWLCDREIDGEMRADINLPLREENKCWCCAGEIQMSTCREDEMKTSSHVDESQLPLPQRLPDEMALLEGS